MYTYTMYPTIVITMHTHTHKSIFHFHFHKQLSEVRRWSGAPVMAMHCTVRLSTRKMVYYDGKTIFQHPNLKHNFQRKVSEPKEGEGRGEESCVAYSFNSLTYHHCCCCCCLNFFWNTYCNERFVWCYSDFARGDFSSINQLVSKLKTL